MKKISLAITFACLTGMAFSQTTGQVKDIDGNTYKTVKIGDAEWMAENLKTSKFQNGEIIPNAKPMQEWYDAVYNKKSGWCSYLQEDSMNTKYGKLYNYTAVKDSRGVCPTGWHVSTDEDWDKMMAYLGADALDKIKSSSGWRDGKNGTNASGFNALPGGFRAHKGDFDRKGDGGYWWVIPKDPAKTGNFRRFIVFWDAAIQKYLAETAGDGYSVRCVKN